MTESKQPTKAEALEALNKVMDRLDVTDGMYDWSLKKLTLRRFIKQAGAVPEGYAIVPVEPTEEMSKQADSNWSGFSAPGRIAPRNAARRLYRAMIAAAPTAEDPDD